jgi:hypothetical protein
LTAGFARLEFGATPTVAARAAPLAGVVVEVSPAAHKQRRCVG